jgi:hypothetical protein
VIELILTPKMNVLRSSTTGPIRQDRHDTLRM